MQTEDVSERMKERERESFFVHSLCSKRFSFVIKHIHLRQLNVWLICEMQECITVCLQQIWSYMMIMFSSLTMMCASSLYVGWRGMIMMMIKCQMEKRDWSVERKCVCILVKNWGWRKEPSFCCCGCLLESHTQKKDWNLLMHVSHTKNVQKGSKRQE